MGKIILTVEGTTVGEVSKGGGVVVTKEVSEVDSGRLIAAYARSYAGTWKNEDGTLRQPTIQEVIEAWFGGIVAGSIAHVESVEKEVKAAEAREEIAPISIL